jgi:hypothetical protein
LKKLHIVSFNNPFPPDYGGVIDVYYKIKSLREAGVSVILHIFEYNRPSSPELNTICDMVYYYPRKTNWLSQLSILPYIVRSRKSNTLLKNLSGDEYPVLFEGLHCCYYLHHPLLKNKQKLVRMHNIEHEYYKYLSKSALNLKTRLYFLTESLKLKRFEEVLKFADYILAISNSDTEYFNRKYGKTIHIGAFHSNFGVSSKEGKGEFLLMHGNLEVEENESAILYCIRNILQLINFPVVIAGKNPGNQLKAEIASHENMILVESPSETEMNRLQHEAHIHLCYTFQASGLKLKLLNSLYKGRFVVANPLMTEGSGLDEIVEVGKSDIELVEIINRLISSNFNSTFITEREEILQVYNNKRNADNINNLLQNPKDKL